MSKPLIFGVCLLVLLSLGLQGYQYYNQEKVVFVSVAKVFNGFEMKKELEADYEAVNDQRKFILDSLKVHFNQRLEMDDDATLDILKREILFKEQQFAESDRILVEQSNGEILTQLNIYMKEFGESRSYYLILGAQGSGSLIYAKPDKNITQEMLKYVNDRYQGK